MTAQDKTKWNKFKGFFKGKFTSKDKGSSNENPPTEAKKEVDAAIAEHHMELWALLLSYYTLNFKSLLSPN